MTIDALTITHVAGEAIYASKHTTQTEKINECIGVINNQTDLYFQNDGLEWHPDMHTDNTGYDINPTSWSGDSTNKIQVPNLNGKYLVSLMIKEDRTETEGTLSEIKVYAGPYTSDSLILNINALAAASYQCHDDTDAEKRYWVFNLGLYKLPDTPLLIRIYNSSGAEILAIEEIQFTGYT